MPLRSIAASELNVAILRFAQDRFLDVSSIPLLFSDFCYSATGEHVRYGVVRSKRATISMATALTISSAIQIQPGHAPTPGNLTRRPGPFEVSDDARCAL
jgi:hypothetical protein